MSLPLSCSASRSVPLPNADAGYSNTGLRRLQEILILCLYVDRSYYLSLLCWLCL
jgi:hypothetical protein